MPRHLAVTVGTLPAPPEDGVPTGAYTLGTQVGVPSGTTLTPTSGIPTADAVETVTLYDPDADLEAEINGVQVWRNRSWTDRITPSPDAGDTYMFENCSWDVEFGGDNFFALDVGEANARNDRMDPLVIFRRCTFRGTLTHRVLHGGYAWVDHCDIDGTDDGFFRLAYSTVLYSNIVGRSLAEGAHADAMQESGPGECLVYRSWVHCEGDGSPEGPANAAIRVGTETSGSTGINIIENGLSGGSFTLQLRGDGPGIDGCRVIGNRFVDNAFNGPVDLQFVTDLTWTDNAFFGGEVIPSP